MAKDFFTKSDLKLDDILMEMNSRARSYRKGSSMSVKEAQDQVLQDFARYNQDGKYVPVKKVTGKDEYFTAKE